MRKRTASGMAIKSKEYELEALNDFSPSIRPLTYAKRASSRQELPFWVAALIIAGLFGLFAAAYAFFLRLPRGLTEADEARHSSSFIAERASWHVGNLTDIGDRVAGHVNNEVHAVNYLLQAIDKIRSDAHSSNVIEVDHQIANGSYWRDKAVYSHLNVYRGVQNVVVKLGRKSKPDSDFYILLNSHFDSVSMSPGAGDDATMVGVMLEVLNFFARRENPFDHSIVFLFNGCEEFELSGSHAFTSHMWFKKINAIMNLDAGGIGGKEMLFRATRDNPWIMRAYSRGAEHAFASTIGEEIFEVGIINSDTDFRNWNIYAKDAAALDLAQNLNGYVYHTKYDDFNLIDLGSLQHTGDNVIEIIYELENTKEMRNPPDTPEQAGSIFFDLMGLVFVHYSYRDGIIVNFVVAICLLVVIFLCMYSVKRKERLTYCRLSIECVNALLIQISSLALSCVVLILLANLYSLVGRPFTWFSNSWLIFLIYYCPFLFVMSIAPHFYIKWKEKHNEPTSYFVQMQLHAHCIILVVMLMCTTSLGIRSSFVIMLNAMGYLITTTLNVAIRLYSGGLRWVWLHLVGQLLPITFYFYLAIMGYVILIPTTGRAYNGGHTFPDLTVAMLTIAIAYMTMGFILPLFNLFKFRRHYILTLGLLFGVGLILMITPLGFPFREATASQRYTVWHTERTFYRFDNTMRRSDAGFYVHTYDPIGYKAVKNIVPEMQNASFLRDDCRNELFCAIPFYTGAYHGNSDYSVWIPAPSPVFPRRPSFRLISRKKLDENLSRYTFSISGPSRMYLHLCPLEEARVVRWDLLSPETGVPEAKIKWNGRDMYFIAFGTQKLEYQFQEVRFFVDVETKYLWNKQYVMDIGFGAHFINYWDSYTDELKKFVSGFPAWTNVQHWTAIYEGYQF